jgi:hypothetical protein
VYGEERERVCMERRVKGEEERERERERKEKTSYLFA